jgi:hypothetical protein
MGDAVSTLKPMEGRCLDLQLGSVSSPRVLLAPRTVTVVEQNDEVFIELEFNVAAQAGALNHYKYLRDAYR